MPDLENVSADFRISEKKKLLLFMAAFIYPDLVPDQIISDRGPCTCVWVPFTELWAFRTLDVSYQRRFVPRLDDSYQAVWTFRTQSLDDSYPRAWRCVPKAERFVPSAFLIFCIWFGVFASKIVRFIQPTECWLIRTHFLFIYHTWFGLFTCIYSPMYKLSKY